MNIPKRSMNIITPVTPNAKYKSAIIFEPTPIVRSLPNVSYVKRYDDEVSIVLKLNKLWTIPDKNGIARNM